MELPAKLKKLRESRGISIYKLTKISDVSENHIRLIERGESQPSIQVLERLLKALGTNLAEFFNEDSEVIYPTEYERDLLRHVRSLSSEKADAVLSIAKLLNK